MTGEKFSRITTPLPGVFLIVPRVFKDSRGFFLETYTRKDFAAIGIRDEFVQDNHSCSAKGVLRGLHFQSRHPQGKLVRVVRGSIYDAVVDLRKGSPSWNRWMGVTLSSGDPRFLWVPPGLAHGFLSLEDHTEVLYKTTEYYHPEHDAGIRWDDPGLGIAWPLGEYGIPAPLVSPKDAALPPFSGVDSPFSYEGDD